MDRLVDAVFTRCVGGSLGTPFRTDDVADVVNSCGLFAGMVDGSALGRDVAVVDDRALGGGTDTDAIKGGWDASLE